MTKTKNDSETRNVPIVRARHAPGRLIPPFDASRVEAIQTAIDAGCYEPHPDVIADKLIENIDEQVSRKR